MKRTTILSLAVGLSGLTAVAQAQYEVQGNVQGWSVAGYNVNQTGGYTTLAPYGNATASAPLDTTGTLTSAFANVSGNGSGYPHDPNTYDSLGITADLSTVTQTLSEHNTGTDNAYDGYDGGNTTSSLSDTLTFNVAGANSSTVTTVDFTRVIQGSMLQNGSYAEGTGEVYSTWQLTNTYASAAVDLQLNASSNYQNYINGAGGEGTFTTLTPGLIIQQGSFSFTGSSFSTEYISTMWSTATSGVDQNYSSDFSLDLPTGVTYTSSSGVFGVAATPEPCTMVIVGSGLFAAYRRRRAQL